MGALTHRLPATLVLSAFCLGALLPLSQAGDHCDKKCRTWQKKCSAGCKSQYCRGLKKTAIYSASRRRYGRKVKIPFTGFRCMYDPRACKGACGSPTAVKCDRRFCMTHSCPGAFGKTQIQCRQGSAGCDYEMDMPFAEAVQKCAARQGDCVVVLASAHEKGGEVLYNCEAARLQEFRLKAETGVLGEGVDVQGAQKPEEACKCECVVVHALDVQTLSFCNPFLCDTVPCNGVSAEIGPGTYGFMCMRRARGVPPNAIARAVLEHEAEHLKIVPRP